MTRFSSIHVVFFEKFMNKQYHLNAPIHAKIAREKRSKTHSNIQLSQNS
jgi:hypothetical protein